MNVLYRGIINDVEAPLQRGMSEPAHDSGSGRRPLNIEPGYQGQSSVRGEASPPLKLLLGVTGLVLLIACAEHRQPAARARRRRER